MGKRQFCSRKYANCYVNILRCTEACCRRAKLAGSATFRSQTLNHVAEVGMSVARNKTLISLQSRPSGRSEPQQRYPRAVAGPRPSQVPTRNVRDCVRTSVVFWVRRPQKQGGRTHLEGCLRRSTFIGMAPLGGLDGLRLGRLGNRKARSGRDRTQIQDWPACVLSPRGAGRPQLDAVPGPYLITKRLRAAGDGESVRDQEHPRRVQSGRKRES